LQKKYGLEAGATLREWHPKKRGSKLHTTLKNCSIVLQLS